MDCPKYTNAITLTYNPALKEMVVNFFHEYPVVEKPVDADGGKIKTTFEREHVCGAVLPEKVAGQLYSMLGAYLEKAKDNE